MIEAPALYLSQHTQQDSIEILEADAMLANRGREGPITAIGRHAEVDFEGGLNHFTALAAENLFQILTELHLESESKPATPSAGFGIFFLVLLHLHRADAQTISCCSSSLKTKHPPVRAAGVGLFRVSSPADVLANLILSQSSRLSAELSFTRTY